MIILAMKILDLVLQNLDVMSKVAILRDSLEQGLLAIDPSINIHGRAVDRLPNTVCVSMPGVDAETQVISLDLAGIMISAGSACSSGKVTASHVLKAMGLDDEIISSAIRVSLGWQTTIDDVKNFLVAWRDLYENARVPRATAAE